MKKFLIVATLLAFTVSGVLFAFAQDDKVNCCAADGKCSQVAKADCEKAKGTVVKDCKDCKPAEKK
jgi:hypothetical protein